MRRTGFRQKGVPNANIENKEYFPRCAQRRSKEGFCATFWNLGMWNGGMLAAADRHVAVIAVAGDVLAIEA
jgi:hypothetical protein